MQVVIGKKKKKKERREKPITESHSGRTTYNKQIAVKNSGNIYTLNITFNDYQSYIYIQLYIISSGNNAADIHMYR